jgi:peptidoglycan/xylan/chitin deacetylase (PgdA/CDA1 family)
MLKLLCLPLVSLLLSSGVVTAQTRTVAMTVDDLPFASPDSVSPADAKEAIAVNQKILHAFARHHISAIGFVIEEQAEDLGLPVSKDILKHWIGSGFSLGNHTYSHPDVNTLTVDGIEQEIMRGETTFAPLLQKIGRRPEFLRFPYNHTGDTKEKHDAVAAFLAARGYRLAPCTIDNSDYEFNATYVLALALHDEAAAAKVRADYIAYTGAEIDWYTKLNREVLGYDPPHIMLLHDSPLNADTIEDVISLFDQRGYSFVALDEALRSPAYAIPETFITKGGMMWGYRWAAELGVKVHGRDEPDPPAWIAAYREEHSPHK